MLWLLAALAAIVGGGATWIKSNREHELGMKGLDLQKYGMDTQSKATIRASREKQAMSREDRRMAMELRNIDREYGRMDKDKDRQMMDKAMQMQFINALLQTGESGKQRPPSANPEISMSSLMQAM